MLCCHPPPLLHGPPESIDEFPWLPPLSELRDIPDRDECTRQRDEWRRSLEWYAEAVHAWPDRRPLIWACMWQCREHIALWDALREAQGDGSEEGRRERLGDAITILGPRRWLLRDLPLLPPSPRPIKAQ